MIIECLLLSRCPSNEEARKDVIAEIEKAGGLDKLDDQRLEAFRQLPLVLKLDILGNIGKVRVVE